MEYDAEHCGKKTCPLIMDIKPDACMMILQEKP